MQAHHFKDAAMFGSEKRPIIKRVFLSDKWRARGEKFRWHPNVTSSMTKKQRRARKARVSYTEAILYLYARSY